MGFCDFVSEGGLIGRIIDLLCPGAGVVYLSAEWGALGGVKIGEHIACWY